MTNTICMISCLHPLQDDRIYWKEALSLKNHGYEVIHIGVGSQNRDFISNEGIRLIEIARKRYFTNPFVDKLYRLLTFRPNIYKKILIQAELLNADVYHFHDLQLNRIGPKLKKLSHKPKVIYDVHEPYPVTISCTFTKWKLISYFYKLYGHYIENWENKRAGLYDLIIATEENVSSRFTEIVSEKKVEIIYNYTNLTPISSPIHKKEYDLIYTGSIRRIRGIIEIIESIKLIKQQIPEIKILIIGFMHEEWLASTLQNIIKSNKLEANVIIKESVPYNDIIDFYQQSKIGLAVFYDLPVHRTILPIKIFEYMAFGLPVITNNFGHMGKLTSENNTGVRIASVSPSDIATAAIKLLTDKKTYSEISKNCLSAAKEKYKWEIMENKLISIYKDLIE